LQKKSIIAGQALQIYSFLSSLKEKKQKKGAKTSWARRPVVRLSESFDELATLRQHLMSICLSRSAIQESKKIPIIVHPINTSSCGMFSKSLSLARKGKGSASDTKTLMEGGLCPKSIASSPYRGRPWRGWMSLGSFSAPENERSADKLSHS